MDFTYYSNSSRILIEDFMQNLAEKYPTVAKCVAKRGFGDLSYWLVNENGGRANIKTAKCGCLVGNAALCMIDQPGLLENIEKYLNSQVCNIEDLDASVILFLCFCFLENLKLPDSIGISKVEYLEHNKETDKLLELFSSIEEVGLAVDRESCDRSWIPLEDSGKRELDMKEYMQDRLLEQI